MKYIQFPIVDTAAEMIQFYLCEHFFSKNRTQPLTYMFYIFCITRIGKTAGKHDYIFIAYSVERFYDEIYSAHASCIEPAAIDDDIILSKFFSRHLPAFRQVARKRLRYPFSVFFCASIF